MNKALERYLVVVLMHQEDIELVIEKAHANHVSEIETTFLDTTDYKML